MKKISAIRNIPYLTIILLTLICILLLSSKNMIMSQASYPEATIVSSGLSTLFQTNFFRLFFRYCTGV